MRIQFINVRYDENKYRYRVNKLWPPLGMASVASVIRADGHEVEILDMEALRMEYDQLAEYLTGKTLDVIGVHGTTPTSHFIAQTVRIARAKCPRATIVVGGCHATLLPAELFAEMPEVDYLFRGEAEYSFRDFLRLLGSGTDDQQMSKVPGIGFLRDGQLVLSPETPIIDDLDALPPPSYDLLPLDAYFTGSREAEAERPERAITIMSTRGCPQACIFCCEPVVYGHRYRARSAKSIVDEIEMLRRDYHINHINFYDASFMVERPRVESICREILDRRVPVTWRARARADHLTLPLARLMRDAGCTELAIGVETGSQRLLDVLNKQTTIEQIEECFRICHEVGMWTSAFFLFGVPGETLDESYQTVEFAKKLDPDWALFTHATPLPGTRLYEMVRDQLMSHDWGDFRFAANSPVVGYGNLSKEKIQQLMNYAFRSFYVRKEWLLGRLRKSTGPAMTRQIVDSFFDYLEKTSPIE